MTNDVLISVPLFVFMGYIIERTNILDRLFRSIQLAGASCFTNSPHPLSDEPPHGEPLVNS